MFSKFALRINASVMLVFFAVFALSTGFKNNATASVQMQVVCTSMGEAMWMAVEGDPQSTAPRQDCHECLFCALSSVDAGTTVAHPVGFPPLSAPTWFEPVAPLYRRLICHLPPRGPPSFA